MTPCVRRLVLLLFAVGLVTPLAPAVDAAWVSYGGSWYSSTASAKSFANAEVEAQSFGGHLVSINSQSEQDFLTATFRGPNLWIGLTDAAQEGVFQWLDGSPVTYTNWHSGEPNNFGSPTGSGEDYAIMNYGPPGAWNDYAAASFLGIMEVVNAAPTSAVAPVGSLSYGSIVDFDGSMSSDQNSLLGDVILAYNWDIAGLIYTTTIPELAFDTSLLGGAGTYSAQLQSVDRLGAVGTYAFQFDVTSPSAVPEPPSVALLGIGACVGALGAARRRALT